MLINKSKGTEPSNKQVLLKERPLKIVDKFKYFGANIKANSDCVQDIRIRTATALLKMNDLHKIWKSNGVKSHTKMRLCKALIIPIALYGCQIWTLNQAAENKILVFEMAVLRKILGITRLDKIRNVDIRTGLGCNKTLVQVIHERQHRWM